MATTFVGVNGSGGAAATLAVLLHDDGTLSHRHAQLLARPDALIRDVADALHVLGMLHGHHPDLFARALAHGQPQTVAPWLTTASEGFTIERQWLTALIAAVGPLPSTPGQAESEAAVLSQRHALNTLMQSDRAGCAVGAAAALALDWTGIRALLSRAASRLGVAIPADALPSPDDVYAVLDAFAAQPPFERAIRFGAQQLLAQHRGMWNLLEARASARNEI